MRLLTLVLATLLAGCGGSSTTPEPAPVEQPPSEQSPLEVACDSGVIQSCLRAGNDAELAGDFERAADLYHKACDLKDATGCVLSGGARLEAGDLAAALGVLERACQMKDGTGCYGAGMIAGGIYGGTADPPRAAALFHAGCEAASAASCGSLAQAYAGGVGVEQDLEKAASLRAQACATGDGESCTWQGLQAWRDQKDEAKARSEFERACGSELPDPDGCGYLGWLTYADPKAPDEARGIALLDAACEGLSAAGCNLRAVVHARLNEANEATALRKRACELDPEGCEALSKQFEALVQPGEQPK